MNEHDVLIVGAGPAGSTAAATLAQRGWDVLLVDRAEFPRDKTCGDGLTPRAVAVLERLGLLQEMLAAGYQKINGASAVAPSGAEFRVRFEDYDLGLPHFGLVVPRLDLDDRLRAHAMARGARFRAGLHVTGPLRQKGQVAGVEGRAGGKGVTLRSRLTILATGANIGLLRAFGLMQEMPPGIIAIRGYFTGILDARDEFEFYFDRALSPGYGWVFPLADGRANVGLGLFTQLCGTSANTRRLLAEFMAHHPRLARARPAGPSKGYPLRIDFPRFAPAGPGYLLAGEALGLVHPLTGEGIDLAMESAEIAADTVDAALRNADPGLTAPAKYRQEVLATYAGFFRGADILRHVVLRPLALNLLIRKAPRKPCLAHTIAGINQGVVSPWTALSPRTWWDLLT